MSDYWKQHYDQSVLEHPCSPLMQTGKTVNGVAVDTNQIELIVAHICKSLALTMQDRLLDLGCGNGILTVSLAKTTESVVGIDFTQRLLDYAASNFSAPNVTYLYSNIISFDGVLLKDVTALTMFEVIQHLSEAEFSQCLANLAELPAGARFFIGGIPDSIRLRNYYDTDEKYEYFLACEKNGTPHLGKWWLATKLEAIANRCGWSINRLSQPQDFYSNYYRFDAVLIKQ